MDNSKDRLQKAVDEIMDEAVETLQKLVQIPSITGDEEAAQLYMAELLKDIGLETDFWYPQVEELKGHPAFPMVNSENLGTRPNLVGMLRGTGEGKSLILNGHIDVVNPGEEAAWKHKSPWSGIIENDRLYGRGACDMKAGLLSGVFAMKALIRSGLSVKGDVYLQSVISEEDGGCGTLACLVRGYKADGAVIMEPTQLYLIPAHMGATSFRLTVAGRATHGCVRYEGISAIEKFSYLHDGIIRWERERERGMSSPLFQDYPIKMPISIGTLCAGNWDSTVPEKLIAEGRFGFPLEMTLLEARNSFEDKIKELSKKDPWLKENPPVVEWFQEAWEPASIETDHPLVTTLFQSYIETMGREPKLAGAPYGSDMRLLTRYGQIPALHFGPGDVRKAHFTDEFVPLQEYRDAIAILAHLIHSWCNE